MKTLRRLITLTFLLALSPAASGQASAPPEFLKTNIPAWNRVLNGLILENFRNVNAAQAARRLGELGGAQVIVNIPARDRLPLVTRKFYKVTLRDAFYLLSKDTGLQVDWAYAGKVPQAIRVSLPETPTPENPD
jgi:hypothetical protein